MDIKQAIEVIHELTRGLNENGYVKEANDLAIEALEKQIPKDVQNKETQYVKFCPICGSALLRENDKYCSDCGQKLNWN